MDQFNPLEIVVCGSRRQYYSYDGELYHKTFPYEWAENHAVLHSGPAKCKNCQRFGSWNGVFVAYCANCAEDYKTIGLVRGYGVTDYLCGGIRTNNVEDVDAEFNTYLKDTTLDEIGDKDFMDSLLAYEQECARLEEFCRVKNQKLPVIKGSDTVKDLTQKRINSNK